MASTEALGTDIEPHVSLWGREFRYLLTVLILDGGEQTLAELVDHVHQLGVALNGRPSKVVSDALRWEIRRGRVVRLGRGRYGPGYLPRSTEWRVRRRVADVLRPGDVRTGLIERGGFP